MRKPRRAAWETLSGKAPGPSPGLAPSPATCDTCHFPILGDGNATLPFAPGKTSRVPSDAGVFSSDPKSNWSPTRDLPSGKSSKSASSEPVDLDQPGRGLGSLNESPLAPPGASGFFRLQRSFMGHFLQHPRGQVRGAQGRGFDCGSQTPAPNLHPGASTLPGSCCSHSPGVRSQVSLSSRDAQARKEA
ncbi:uncharacterized protein LOC116270982 [Papio anubis]|uniref:uncharacterized protein LOC116270982 n=1 Tax=Papio anubis TaxID=9555 RepID=UPI0012AE4503|nr:uncharacterized protein LOC116270982 [Papio anubis]